MRDDHTGDVLDLEAGLADLAVEPVIRRALEGEHVGDRPVDGTRSLVPAPGAGPVSNRTSPWSCSIRKAGNGSVIGPLPPSRHTLRSAGMSEPFNGHSRLD